MDRKNLLNIPFSKRDNQTSIIYSTDADLKRMINTMNKRQKMIVVYYLIYTYEKGKYAIIHRHVKNENKTTVRKMINYLKENFMDNVNLEYSQREMTGKGYVEFYCTKDEAEVKNE